MQMKFKQNLKYPLPHSHFLYNLLQNYEFATYPWSWTRHMVLALPENKETDFASQNGTKP